jgi:hypothetical protein
MTISLFLPLSALALVSARPDAESPAFIEHTVIQITFTHVSMGDAQDEARREMRNGNLMPLRDIERKILPVMSGAQYLGPEYDPVAMVYRMKFIRDGRVIFVDVDARSGDILRHSR